jgi:F0F1-type ATP synthase assembly protein I
MTDKATIFDKPLFQAIGLAWDLGYTIAVPLVVLALVGRLADKYWGTSPWFLLLGVVVSIAISSWLIIIKTKSIVDAAQDKIPPAPSKEETKL